MEAVSHDTAHEMARDEARHGKAFERLLKRYKWAGKIIPAHFVLLLADDRAVPQKIASICPWHCLHMHAACVFVFLHQVTVDIALLAVPSVVCLVNAVPEFFVRDD